MSNNPFADVDDVIKLFRPLTSEETEKANQLLPIISDILREEAKKVGKNLDQMVAESATYGNVVKQVVVDILARYLNTPVEGEPMSQFSQSALGYSVSGTYLVPGGGLFIKKTELARLGLRRQKIGVIDFYGVD